MHNTRKINDDVFWVGTNDKKAPLFESVFPIPNGMSYNSYLILDEKTVLLDCVDKSGSSVFFENLKYLLKDKKLDYVIINHVEPDHSAALGDLILRYPDVKIIGNSRTIPMIKQFFDFDADKHAIIVKDGEELSTGKHNFVFYTAPMVHWPEVMFTYDSSDKYLYSADAFGTFGTLNGNIFADELDFDRDFLDEARRYYTNIVAKYGPQVQAVLKKLASLEVSALLPLHGPIWRKNISYYIDKYQKWSAYTPEEDGVLIAYSSVYGNTENAVNILAIKLAEAGIKKIGMFDVSVTHPSFVLSQVFRFSHIVLASTTYNAGIFINMETLVHCIAAHNVKNRTIAFIENGSWAATSGKLTKEILSDLENTTFLDNTVSLKSSVKYDNVIEIENLAKAIMASFPENGKSIVSESKNASEAKVDPQAFFKLTYGLFVLSAAKDPSSAEKHSACIINTVMQITDEPKQIVIAVNKANYTHDVIKESGKFNISVLTTSSDFDVFKRFGFQSSRDVDKFAGFEEQYKKSNNGLYYLTRDTNSFFSGDVSSVVDYGTHSLFTASVSESAVLSEGVSLSYQYYFDKIKPKPAPIQPSSGKNVYVCRICGYIQEYDGELPDDYICPLCKHPKADMELQK